MSSEPSYGGAYGTAAPTQPDDVLRAQAMKRLKKRRDFRGHLLVYVLVNSFFVALWALTNRDGFFWPVFPMLGWGIGVVLNAWDAYGPGEEFSEESIRREMDRLRPQ